MRKKIVRKTIRLINAKKYAKVKNVGERKIKNESHRTVYKVI